MADAEPRGPFKLRSGPYLGEVSALSFLPVPSHISPFPLLLAGTGSELLFYDLRSGDLIKSAHIFQGVRVHGITVGNSSIAAFGERRVKLLRFRAESLSRVGLELAHKVPLFDHWVLDLCFLKEDCWLAVGLTDNSVAIWDAKNAILVAKVRSSERCLLYSMRMWGDGVTALHVASGTIYNQIIVWKVCPQGQAPSHAAMAHENCNLSTSCVQDAKFHHGEFYTASCLFRLIGHEGSIFRMAWSADGSKLVSVSDDRSARIWEMNDPVQAHTAQDENSDCQNLVCQTLFGHNARIWDCDISDSIVITAGEDCTCRVWGMDGSQLWVIKEHVGRGIWRCLFDPSSSLLVTAGFDSAIKVHVYRSPAVEETTKHRGLFELNEHMESFSICAPKVEKHHRQMNSKSEYVRCLRFTQENILYVATNSGYLYHVKIFKPGNGSWTELAQVGETQIICMDLMVVESCDLSLDKEDMIAIGDGKGNVTIVRIKNGDFTPQVVSCFTWSAEKERQLLGIFWCKSLGCSHVFTTNPGGVLKLWKVNDVKCDDEKMQEGHIVSLVAVCTSRFGARIMCLDASIDEEVLLCGDQRGNLTVFHLSVDLVMSNPSRTVKTIPLLNQFKGAHGISSVTSILIATFEFEQIQIRTTGGDGCICYFKYDRNLKSLEFTGMKQLKELSTIQSVVTSATSMEDFAQCKLAIGFTSADFIMWDLKNETKILQVPCGGWRRPYSYHIGVIPEYQSCFAYLKDQTIHVHRVWVPVHERQLFPQVLHMQYHGREIHSLCFVSSGFSSKSCDLWVATGCEDGTVRLTSYLPHGMENWRESKLLGEHVGGSAVRSICFISTMHTFNASLSCKLFGGSRGCGSRNSNEWQFLLISVGAKQVMTSWRLLQDRSMGSNVAHVDTTPVDTEPALNTSTDELASISFQWLSTYMPPKLSSSLRGLDKIFKAAEEGNGSTLKSPGLSDSRSGECSDQRAKDIHVDLADNDWRYLAVTGFLVKHAHSRLAVCFLVVACSDATLSMRALILPYRLWFDVALLGPQPSPVLALHHVALPVYSHFKDNSQSGHAYVVISGATDGSIAFWDVTGTVESFMELVTELQPEVLVSCQKRPKTGRGSQGGRGWRSSTSQLSGKKVQDALNNIEGGNDINGPIFDNQFEASSLLGNHPVGIQTGFQSGSSTNDLPQRNTSTFPSDVHEIKPMYMLNSAHQSGVNCLHASEMKDSLHSKTGSAYCLVSGGDDQALHCVGFDLTLNSSSKEPNLSQSTDLTSNTQDPTPNHPMGFCEGIASKHNLRVLFRERVLSAHTSAVKGIWTDGIWVFSTGLDQRIRCWKIDPCGMLVEDVHLIVSVPEPEALAAIKCHSARNRYQIAVSGRGSQMVEFSCSLDDE